MIGKIARGKPQFGRLVRYLTNPKGNPRRVERVMAANVVEQGESPNVEAVIVEVCTLQDANRRATSKTMHIVRTFHEQLSLSTLAEVGQDVVKDLGYADHSWVSVVHGDKKFRHLHLAISKVYEDPETGRVLNRHLDHGRLKLDRICVEQEIKHGLIRDNHRYKPSRAAEQALTHERERVASQKLATRLRETLAPQLDQAQQWSQVHALANQHGVHWRPIGAGGLRLVEDATGTRCKASEVYRSLSRGQLERRLGPYQPASTQTPKAPRPTPAGHAQTPAALDTEALLATLKRTAVTDLRSADTWPRFHEAAHHHGLRARPRAGGLVLDHLESGAALKASAVSNKLSLSRLEQRLGTYQPSSPAPQETAQAREAERAPDPPTPAQPQSPEATLLDTIKRTGAARELRAATSWPAFHDAAARHRLRALQRPGAGAGTLLLEHVSTGAMVKSSAVGSLLSPGRLHTRLGTYQPPPEGFPPEVQVREEVVALATQQANHAHECRRRAILTTVPAPERATWFEANRHTWKQSQHRIQQLHILGRHLPRERAIVWLRDPQPSPIARIRQYVIDVIDHIKQHAAHVYQRVAEHLNELKRHFTEPTKEPWRVRRRNDALQPNPSLVAHQQTARTHDVHPLPERNVAHPRREPSLLLPNHEFRHLRREPAGQTHPEVRRPLQGQLPPSPDRTHPNQHQERTTTSQRQLTPDRGAGRGRSR